MTEENKDPPPPKLRLSRKPKDRAPEPAAGDGPKAEPKPELKLRQPDNKKASATPHPEGRPFDPENSSDGVEATKPKQTRQPTELPDEPAPLESDDAGRQVEEAIGQVSEDQKKHNILVSILVSILVLLVLFAILGGSAYGLYSLLRSPAESAKATEETSNETVAEPAAESVKPTAAESPAEDSGGIFRGAIEKARAVIEEKAEVDADLQNVQTSGPTEATPTGSTAETGDTATSADTTGPPEAPRSKTQAPEVDSARTAAVTELLRSAHIGGVRTGDRPRLLLNGESYNQGDLVDAETGLRFIGFRDKRLAFRDTQGVVYIKSF
jgi:hypothetical protein